MGFKVGARLLLLLWLLVPARSLSASGTRDEDALQAATAGLCSAEVAMLGESATHGDGHTLAFKVELVERLIDRCGFGAVYFEANQDEFLHLNRRLRQGQPVTPEDVLSSVGGLWKFYREFQPLALFLLTRARAGSVTLAGLDDQLGQVGQDYANVGMISEWTDLLGPRDREACGTAFHRRIFYDYSQTAPYTSDERAHLEGCLDRIEAASRADAGTSDEEKEERRQMLGGTRRWLSRDFGSGPKSIVNRDRSMFQTFEWLQQRAARRRKVIVWAATVHVAKRGDPAWGDHAGTNFGSLVQSSYGEKAFSLGFSACGGFYGRGRDIRLISVPAPNSVEGQLSEDSARDAIFVGPPRLVTFGTAPGAFFTHVYEILRWSDFLDGVVVFLTERSPEDVRMQ